MLLRISSLETPPSFLTRIERQIGGDKNAVFTLVPYLLLFFVVKVAIEFKAEFGQKILRRDNANINRCHQIIMEVVRVEQSLHRIVFENRLKACVRYNEIIREEARKFLITVEFAIGVENRFDWLPVVEAND